MRKQLTAAMVEKQAPPASGRLEIHDTIVPALALRISSSGARSFVVRGRVKGEPSPIRITLGDAAIMKLTDARQAASDTLRAMRAGADPRATKKAEARAEKVLTFEALIDEWSRLHLTHRRPRYAAEAVRALRTGLPDLLSKPASKISRGDAVAALDKVAARGKTIANLVIYARGCFSWAEKRERAPSNPFSRLPVSARPVERDRVLDTEEIRAIWNVAGTLPYPFGPFFQLAILTLQRREEVAGMRWSELDLEHHLWSIPGALMKGARPHDVHLSAPALAVLDSMPRLAGCDFVFTTTGRTPISGYSRAKEIIDREIAKDRGIEPWRLHDLRRTGVTHLAALGFDSIVVDKLLAHQPGKLRGVAGIYQRHDFARERATALDAWAAHVIGTEADNVVSLAARAAQ
jgi:integrase